ncbi:ANO5 [Bugula neritina]|uniref:ANO5 n=1 Tax=Bugula neritina TaxID=10212 RepID=A0A7J7KDI7_BUGNE|nr:ANO5 [Bugula neritina]
MRKIDFVLAYDSEKNYRSNLRETFEENLLKAGLELELVPPTESCDGKTAFLKVHAPWQVLTKFAESNSLRMPVIENEIELARRRKKFYIKPRKGTADLQPCCTDIQQMVLRLLDWVYKNILLNEEMKEPTPYCMVPYSNVGIYKLLSMKVFTAAFPLHDGPVDVHPFDYSIDLNVLDNTSFLGFYTSYLVVPAVFGVLVFLFGIFTRSSIDTPSDEICNELGNEAIACAHVIRPFFIVHCTKLVITHLTSRLYTAKDHLHAGLSART